MQAIGYNTQLYSMYTLNACLMEPFLALTTLNQVPIKLLGLVPRQSLLTTAPSSTISGWLLCNMPLLQALQ